MLSPSEAEEFMQMPLAERFHIYMVNEICSEEAYQSWIRKNNYDYFPMLSRIKNELPKEFYAYFHDLLHEEERNYYHQKYLRFINGIG